MFGRSSARLHCRQPGQRLLDHRPRFLGSYNIAFTITKGRERPSLPQMMRPILQAFSVEHFSSIPKEAQQPRVSLFHDGRGRGPMTDRVQDPMSFNSGNFGSATSTYPIRAWRLRPGA